MVFSEEQQTLSFPTDTIQPVIFYNTGSGFTMEAR